MLPFKQFVHIVAVATHFLGKPRHTIALFAQLSENHVAEMDVVHGQSCPLFFSRQTP